MTIVLRVVALYEAAQNFWHFEIVLRQKEVKCRNENWLSPAVDLTFWWKLQSHLRDFKPQDEHLNFTRNEGNYISLYTSVSNRKITFNLNKFKKDFWNWKSNSSVLTCRLHYTIEHLCPKLFLLYDALRLLQGMKAVRNFDTFLSFWGILKILMILK